MKYFILFFLSWQFTFAQSEIKLDCNILKAAITSKAFIKHFNICNNKNVNFLVVDTNKYFNDCAMLESCNKKFHISRDYPSSVNVNKTTAKEHSDKIILYKVEQLKNRSTLSFWQPYGNAGLVLELCQRKNKISCKVISQGVF